MQCQCLLPPPATVPVGVAMAVASTAAPGHRHAHATDVAADYLLDKCLLLVGSHECKDGSFGADISVDIPHRSPLFFFI
jgi:hypothetical protein